MGTRGGHVRSLGNTELVATRRWRIAATADMLRTWQVINNINQKILHQLLVLIDTQSWK